MSILQEIGKEQRQYLRQKVDGKYEDFAEEESEEEIEEFGLLRIHGMRQVLLWGIACFYSRISDEVSDNCDCPHSVDKLLGKYLVK